MEHLDLAPRICPLAVNIFTDCRVQKPLFPAQGGQLTFQLDQLVFVFLYQLNNLTNILAKSRTNSPVFLHDLVGSLKDLCRCFIIAFLHRLLAHIGLVILASFLNYNVFGYQHSEYDFPCESDDFVYPSDLDGQEVSQQLPSLSVEHLYSCLFSLEPLQDLLQLELQGRDPGHFLVEDIRRVELHSVVIKAFKLLRLLDVDGL